jgi:hypothetical protein
MKRRRRQRAAGRHTTRVRGARRASRRSLPKRTAHWSSSSDTYSTCGTPLPRPPPAPRELSRLASRGPGARAFAAMSDQPVEAPATDVPLEEEEAAAPEEAAPDAADAQEAAVAPEAPHEPPAPPPARRRAPVSRRCIDDPWAAMSGWLTRACMSVRAPMAPRAARATALAAAARRAACGRRAARGCAGTLRRRAHAAHAPPRRLPLPPPRRRARFPPSGAPPHLPGPSAAPVPPATRAR